MKAGPYSICSNAISSLVVTAPVMADRWVAFMLDFPAASRFLGWDGRTFRTARL